MEIFLLLLVIIILLSIRSNFSNKNHQLLYELNKLKAELLELKSKLTAIQFHQHADEPKQEHTQASTTAVQDPNKTSSTVEEYTVKTAFTPLQPITQEADIPEVIVHTQTEKDNAQELVAEPVQQLMPLYDIDENKGAANHSGQVKQKSTFFEKNPDLEKFIGENLVNKIGIAILVLGIGYFVKFAIDKEWINEIGRVAIGLLCGGILIAVAHRLRKDFAAFSSVLVGGGIAVLYFTVSMAFHDYHLLSQSLAFFIMFLITVFTVVLAIAYNKIELALLAIIGGFGAPFFVSTGQGNHIILFSYLLVLNCGMLSLAYYKKWSLVNVVCYVFTVFIFAGWLFGRYNQLIHNPLIVIVFALCFYLIFFVMNIIYNLKNKIPFKVLDLSLLLSNTFLFFGTGLYLLNTPQLHDFKGLFTLCMGVFNLLFAYPLYKRNSTDKNLIFLLIGIVLTFISLAAPVQLKGHYITLFWAAEAVLLLWLSQKSGIKLIKQTSILVLVLMLISLVLDWYNIYGGSNQSLIPFANKAFITGIFTVAALTVKFQLLRNEQNSTFNISFIELKQYKIVIQTLTLLLLYLVFFFEIAHQVNYFYKQQAVTHIMMLAYHFSYLTLLIQWKQQRKFGTLNQAKIAILSLTILLFFLCNENIIQIRNEILTMQAPLKLFFYVHFYIIALVFYLIHMLHKSLLSEVANDHSKHKYIYSLNVLLYTITASIELDHLVVYGFYSKVHTIAYLLNQNHRFGYAILWGAFAFVLINIGMKRKIRELRIISLALFTLVVLKLFLYDISNISEAGRIVAFVMLGVILLLVSFMYQRLKKLITSDNESVDHEKNE